MKPASKAISARLRSPSASCSKTRLHLQPAHVGADGLAAVPAEDPRQVDRVDPRVRRELGQPRRRRALLPEALLDSREPPRARRLPGRGGLGAGGQQLDGGGFDGAEEPTPGGARAGGRAPGRGTPAGPRAGPLPATRRAGSGASSPRTRRGRRRRRRGRSRPRAGTRPGGRRAFPARTRRPGVRPAPGSVRPAAGRGTPARGSGRGSAGPRRARGRSGGAPRPRPPRRPARSTHPPGVPSRTCVFLSYKTRGGRAR